MRLSLGHKLTVAFSLALAILVGTSIATLRHHRALERSTELLHSAQLTVAAADRVLASTLDAEAGLRVYATNGSPERRANFDRAQREAHRQLSLFLTAVAQDSLRLQRGRQLQRDVEQLLNELQNAVSARDTGGERAAIDALQRMDERNSRKRVSELLLALLSSEHALLTSREQSLRRDVDRTSVLLGVTLSFALLLAPLGYLMVRRELTERRLVEEQLRASDARFRAATDGSMDAFYVLRAVHDARGDVLDFEFVDLNARAGALLGHPPEAIVGQRLCEMIPSTRAEGFFDKYCSVMQSGLALEEEFEVRNPRVNAAWIHHQVVPLRDGVAITSRDITERRQQEEALRALSLIDELTGLYNRRGFLTLAQQQLKLARRGHRELLLLFIDMDDFKEINDSFGHGEGDTALRRTSDILRRTFRDSDILGRVGGDEFVVLATDSGATTTEAIMLRLRRELQERNASDGYPYRLSFSVGIARFDPEAPPSLEELMAAADSMLYEQKRFKRQTSPVPA